MNSFRYTAKGPGGKTVEGTVQANDKSEAVAQLRGQNLVVMKVDEAAAGKSAGKAAGGGAKKGITSAKPGGTREELVMFTRQLATMIGAGLALLESLEVLGEQAESKPMKATCAKLVNEVRGGCDLSVAMETCPKAFDELYISMVRAGE
ncbi:MAG: type II secretion system F family protein, partial [Planctomycetota bacterium]